MGRVRRGAAAECVAAPTAGVDALEGVAAVAAFIEIDDASEACVVAPEDAAITAAFSCLSFSRFLLGDFGVGLDDAEGFVDALPVAAGAPDT